MRQPPTSPIKSVISGQWSVDSQLMVESAAGDPTQMRQGQRFHWPLCWSLVSARGQSTLEYAVFTAVVAAALVAMQVYLRRAIQANLRGVENQINTEAVQ